MALSVVYVGVDNLLIRGGRDVRRWIALAFGFVHGFGLAIMLGEMDQPNRIGWSLYPFNAGIILGEPGHDMRVRCRLYEIYLKLHLS